MASFYGNWAGGDDYRAVGVLTTQSAATYVKAKVGTSVESWYGYDGGGGTTAKAKVHYGSNNEGTVSGKSFSSGTTTFMVNSPEMTIQRTHSRQNISLSGSVTSYAGTSSWSGSVSIDPLSSKTISFNANGGTGAPGSQTKWYGETLVISKTQPTRSGYKFMGWATTANASSATIQPGSNYTNDPSSDVTLYAVWKQTFTVAYNANGGSGAPASQTKLDGTNLTLSTVTPSRTGYSFAGWNTAANGSGTNYAAGGTYSSNAAVTLYAKWTPNTYTVTFNTNGGSIAPNKSFDNQTKTHDVSLTLRTVTDQIVRSGYSFIGWSTTQGGDVEYANGGTYTANSAVTLYAQWRADTPAATVREYFRTSGTQSSGSYVPDDSGTKCAVTVDWTQADSSLGGLVTITAELYPWAETPGSGTRLAQASQNFPASGSTYVTSGTFSLILKTVWIQIRSITLRLFPITTSGILFDMNSLVLRGTRLIFERAVTASPSSMSLMRMVLRSEETNTSKAVFFSTHLLTPRGRFASGRTGRARGLNQTKQTTRMRTSV